MIRIVMLNVKDGRRAWLQSLVGRKIAKSAASDDAAALRRPPVLKRQFRESSPGCLHLGVSCGRRTRAADNRRLAR